MSAAAERIEHISATDVCATLEMFTRHCELSVVCRGAQPDSAEYALRIAELCGVVCFAFQCTDPLLDAVTAGRQAAVADADAHGDTIADVGRCIILHRALINLGKDVYVEGERVLEHNPVDMVRGPEEVMYDNALYFASPRAERTLDDLRCAIWTMQYIMDLNEDRMSKHDMDIFKRRADEFVQEMVKHTGDSS